MNTLANFLQPNSLRELTFQRLCNDLEYDLEVYLRNASERYYSDEKLVGRILFIFYQIPKEQILREKIIYLIVDQIKKRFFMNVREEMESAIETGLRPSASGDNVKITRLLDMWAQESENRYMFSDLSRQYYIENFSWSIPSIDAIKEIVRFAGSEQILEVCAGNCFWACLIRLYGGNIIASDNFSSHGTEQYNCFISDVLNEDAVRSVQSHRTNVIMISWPTYNDPLATNVLDTFEGNRLIFVGEGAGGCTANDSFFDLLREKWSLVKYLMIPNWPGLHDGVYFYERKPEPKVYEEPWILIQSK